MDGKQAKKILSKQKKEVANFVDNIKNKHPFVQVRLLCEQVEKYYGYKTRKLAHEYLNVANIVLEKIEDKELRQEAFTLFYKPAQFKLCDIENI